VQKEQTHFQHKTKKFFLFHWKSLNPLKND
jgi:hypothetical protein